MVLKQDATTHRAEEVAAILDFARAEALRSDEATLAKIRDLNRIRLVERGALVRHLDSAISIRRYQRKADQISAIVGSARLLDWGSFCGQMTFLLARRGVDAVPFDIEENRLARTLNDLLSRPTTYSSDLVRLPFGDGSFEAVLSSGTLEHAADPTRSLKEIWRVLKPGGRLLIYNLPNLLSWVEAIMQLRGNAHERRYLLSGARRWLWNEGFRVDSVGYENVLPCSLSSVNRRLRQLLFPVLDFMSTLDPWLERTLPFRLFATNLTLIATKA